MLFRDPEKHLLVQDHEGTPDHVMGALELYPLLVVQCQSRPRPDPSTLKQMMPEGTPDYFRARLARDDGESLSKILQSFVKSGNRNQTSQAAHPHFQRTVLVVLQAKTSPQ
jgi:hypothetical protein